MWTMHLLFTENLGNLAIDLLHAHAHFIFTVSSQLALTSFRYNSEQETRVDMELCS